MAETITVSITPEGLEETTIDSKDKKIKYENIFTLNSNKNNTFDIYFKNCSHSITINAYQKNNSLNIKYERIYDLTELKKNKFLSICDSIDEIYEQIIFELKKNNNKNIIEEENKINIIIPIEHIKAKEIIFILYTKLKTERELIKDLQNEINNIKEENQNIKIENQKIKEEMELIKKDNIKLNYKNTYLENLIKTILDKLKISEEQNEDTKLSEISDNQKNNKDIIIKKDDNNSEEKYNNIIYYNENINDLELIYKECEEFERNISGSFILCINFESLKLVKEDIIKENNRDSTIKFNLILGDINLKNFEHFYKTNKNFSDCIQNICIYSKNSNSYNCLSNYSIKISNIYNNKQDIINFIKNFSSKETKPFPLPKLILYQDYINKYKKFHHIIAKYYGDLTQETFNLHINKLKSIIKEEEKENKLYNKNVNLLIEGFLYYEIRKDLKLMDELIIKEWTKTTISRDLNKWLIFLKMKNFDTIAYFTARLMYSLNSYAHNNKEYCISNKKKLFRRVKKSYSSLLPFERAKGKIIVLSSFISTFNDENIIKKSSGKEEYKNNLKFITNIIITNHYKRKYISNVIDIAKLSNCNIKEYLFQPFSFYFVKDVKIDMENYSAEIHLDTVGKMQILEEKIKIGKEIEYNEKDKIIQIKQ